MSLSAGRSNRTRPRSTSASPAQGRRPRGRRSPIGPQSGSGAVAVAVGDIRRIFRALRLAEQRTRRETGLSAAQLFVLQQLADGDATSLTALAERTMTDRTSIAHLLGRLEEQGLATTARSTADRRRVGARITATGLRALHGSGPAPTSLLVSAITALPASAQRGLATHLAALVAAMGLTDDPAVMLFEDGIGAEEGR